MEGGLSRAIAIVARTCSNNTQQRAPPCPDTPHTNARPITMMLCKSSVLGLPAALARTLRANGKKCNAARLVTTRAASSAEPEVSDRASKRKKTPPPPDFPVFLLQAERLLPPAAAAAATRVLLLREFLKRLRTATFLARTG